MLIWSRQIKHKWIRGRWREMKWEENNRSIRSLRKMYASKRESVQTALKEAGQMPIKGKRFVDEEWLIDHCIRIANARASVAHFSKIITGWDVSRKYYERIKVKLLLILYTEQSVISLYVCFTKRFDQVILMYKIGNTRIEFQTSSRIKLQLAGSINESRPFTSLSRRFQRKSDT